MRPDFAIAVQHLSVRQEAFLRAVREKDAARVYDNHSQRKEREEKAADDLGALIDVVTIVMASKAQRLAFAERLSTYDVATIEALQANAEALEAASDERDALLEEARVLPDGRRVFESDDGIRVVDEHGNDVAPDVITASEIDDWRPSAEEYLAVKARLHDLTTERETLLTFQEQLDDMRDRLDAGDLTAVELDEFDAVLDDAPAALDAFLPDAERIQTLRLEGVAANTGPDAEEVAPVLGLDL